MSVAVYQSTRGYFSYDLKTIKAIPLQPWAGPEGSRRLKLPDFKEIGTLKW
jgi:hypothetical protein